MGKAERIIIVAILGIIDLVVFFAPVCACLIGYVLIARPRWAKEFIDMVYEG